MNSLSWFIYISDVIPRVSSTFVILGTIFLFAYAFYTVFTWANEVHSWNTEYEGQVIIDRKKNYKSTLKWLIVPITLFFMAAALPSKDTLYLIAGSEVGEVAVNSEEGKEIMRDVHEVIKHQLNKLKESKE